MQINCKSPTSATYSLCALALLALSLAIGLCGLLVEAGKIDCSIVNPLMCLKLAQFKRAYDQIDDYLSNNVLNNDDPKANIKAAADWLHTMTQQPLSQDKATLVQSLTQFLDLTTSDGPSRCTKFTYKTIMSNDQAIGSQLKSLKLGQTPKRRIGKVLYWYAAKYDRECDLFYFHEYKTNYPKLSNDTKLRVGKFARELVIDFIRTNSKKLKNRHANAEHFFDTHFREASKLTERMKRFDNPADIGILYKWLIQFAKEKSDPLLKDFHTTPSRPRSLVRVFPVKVARLFQRYLVKPCEEFVEKLDSGFSRYLAIVLPIIHQEDPQAADYHRDLTYYRACKILVRDQKVMKLRMVDYINSLLNVGYREPIWI